MERVIELNRESLKLCPPGHSGRRAALKNLGRGLRSRFERDGDMQDLKRAIEVHREGLELCPPDHPKRSQILEDLDFLL
jgi:hypothetical protein